MKVYACPCCHGTNSENFKGEDDKIVCRNIVNRGGKFVACDFPYSCHEFNCYETDCQTEWEKMEKGLPYNKALKR